MCANNIQLKMKLHKAEVGIGMAKHRTAFCACGAKETISRLALNQNDLFVCLFT